MTFEDAITLIESGLAPEQLTELQKAILSYVWNGESYLKMSYELQYNHGYIKDVGAGLWRLLSDVLGERVKKHNLRTVLARYQQRQTSANSQVAPALAVYVNRSGNEFEAGFNNEINLQNSLKTFFQYALNEPHPMVAVLDIDNIDKTASALETGLAFNLKHNHQGTASVDLLRNVFASWAAYAQTSQSSQAEDLLTHLLKALGQKTCLLIVKP
jgi:poly-gamma-glutamate capsule biosynthesis protein CapA/YwtB (metallophosphatase superfamily)